MNQNTEQKFKARLSFLMLDMLYMVMINRIANRYTPAELAFLIDKPDSFIVEHEQLERRGFTFLTFAKLSNVFGQNNFDFNRYDKHSENLSEYQMTIREIPNKREYIMERLLPNGESIQEFQEGYSLFDFDHRNNREERIQIASQLGVYIESGVFDKPIYAFPLYKSISDTLETSVVPENLQYELNKLVGRKGKAPLKRMENFKIGYRYVKHKF